MMCDPREPDPGKGYGDEFDRLFHIWEVLEEQHEKIHPAEANKCRSVAECSLRFAIGGLEREMIQALRKHRRKSIVPADIHKKECGGER